MVAKTANDILNYKRSVKFTNAAREGWEAILKSFPSGLRILLPAYIGITDREGSGIYDPVVNTNISHGFYKLNNDLSIPIEQLKTTLQNGKFDLILLVHYFGFEIPNIEKIVQVCRKYNVTIVEDCAHLFNYNLFNLSSTGTYGDFTFYSLHKNFPLEDGGMVVRLNHQLGDSIFEEASNRPDLAVKLMEFDIEGIAARRIENFKIYDALINDIPLIRPLKTLSSNDIPHTYPIVVENDLRERLYFWLIKKNVTLIALYYRLIEPLQNAEYTQMLELSNSILNLPLHQDISKVDIQNITKLIAEGIEELNA